MCLGYAERLRHQKEVAWFQVSLIGSLLFSKKGLPTLAEATGTKSTAPRQDPRELDLMLDLFAYQAKELQKAA